VVGITVLTFLRPFTFQIANLLSLRDGYGGVVLKAERASGIRVERSRGAYDDMIRYIQENVPQDAPVFVGNLRHDRISINDVMLYFLCGRESATRYHELHPGLATTLECQKEIVDEIKGSGVEVVILGGFDDEGREREEGARLRGEASVFAWWLRRDKTTRQDGGDGSSFLDEFLRGNFVCVTNFGGYAVLGLAE